MEPSHKIVLENSFHKSPEVQGRLLRIKINSAHSKGGKQSRLLLLNQPLPGIPSSPSSVSLSHAEL